MSTPWPQSNSFQVNRRHLLGTWCCGIRMELMALLPPARLIYLIHFRRLCKRGNVFIARFTTALNNKLIIYHQFFFTYYIKDHHPWNSYRAHLTWIQLIKYRKRMGKENVPMRLVIFSTKFMFQHSFFFSFDIIPTPDAIVSYQLCKLDDESVRFFHFMEHAEAKRRLASIDNSRLNEFRLDFEWIHQIRCRKFISSSKHRL